MSPLHRPGQKITLFTASMKYPRLGRDPPLSPVDKVLKILEDSPWEDAVRGLPAIIVASCTFEPTDHYH